MYRVFAIIKPMKRHGKFKTLAGFTLLEVLIYLAIFTIVSLAFSRIVMSLIAINAGQDARNEVLQQSNYSLETIQRLIGEATTVVVRNKWGTGSDSNVYYYKEYPPVNPTGQNPCATNLTNNNGKEDEADCQPYTLTEERTTTTGNKLATNGGALGGIIESHLYLKMGNETNDNVNDPNSPVHIYLDGATGKIALEQGKGTGHKTLYLTDDKVKLTKLTFTKIIKVRKDVNPLANLVTISGSNTDVILNGYKCIRSGSNHICDTLYGNILQADDASQGALAGELDKTKVTHIDGPEVVNIDLAMNYNSTSPYKQFTKNFSLGVSKAKAAVFDTSLTPSTSSAKIGTSSNRWDIFGGNIDTTNLTIGSGGSSLNKIIKGTFTVTAPSSFSVEGNTKVLYFNRDVTISNITSTDTIIITSAGDPTGGSGSVPDRLIPVYKWKDANTINVNFTTPFTTANGGSATYTFNYIVIK